MTLFDFSKTPQSKIGIEIPMTLEKLESFLKQANFKIENPFLLICENGSVSLQAAHLLIEKNFINVVVLENGIESIDFSSARLLL